MPNASRVTIVCLPQATPVDDLESTAAALLPAAFRTVAGVALPHRPPTVHRQTPARLQAHRRWRAAGPAGPRRHGRCRPRLPLPPLRRLAPRRRPDEDRPAVLDVPRPPPGGPEEVHHPTSPTVLPRPTPHRRDAYLQPSTQPGHGSAHQPPGGVPSRTRHLHPPRWTHSRTGQRSDHHHRRAPQTRHRATVGPAHLPRPGPHPPADPHPAPTSSSPSPATDPPSCERRTGTSRFAFRRLRPEPPPRKGAALMSTPPGPSRPRPTARTPHPPHHQRDLGTGTDPGDDRRAQPTGHRDDGRPGDHPAAAHPPRAADATAT